MSYFCMGKSQNHSLLAIHLNKAVNDLGISKKCTTSKEIFVYRSAKVRMEKLYFYILEKKYSETHFFLIPIHTVAFVNHIVKCIIFHVA